MTYDNLMSIHVEIDVQNDRWKFVMVFILCSNRRQFQFKFRILMAICIRIIFIYQEDA